MNTENWHEKVYSPRPSQDWNLWKRIKEAVLERDWYRCQACFHKGKKNTLTAHHIIPRDQGGTNDLDNLITLCPSCHDAIEPLGMRTASEITGYFIPEKNVREVEEHEPIETEDWRPGWHKYVYGGCKR